MMLKKVLQPSPLRLVMLFLLYFILYVFHIWCQPILIVTGELTAKCSLFSEWIWNNPIIYNIYTKINSWHILIITIFLMIICNLIIEVIKNKKLLKEKNGNK